MAEYNPVCFICLSEDGEMCRPCNCPRQVHAQCVARWQVYNAGREEEKICRFCKATLPDWRLVPAQSRSNIDQDAVAAADPSHTEHQVESGGTDSQQQQQQQLVSAFMRISFNGKSHKIKVQPGQTGSQKFVEDCRKLLGIPEDVEFDVVFHCKEPFTGGSLSFRSLAAYDAAVACAALATSSSPSLPDPSLSTSSCRQHPDAALPHQAPVSPVPSLLNSPPFGRLAEGEGSMVQHHQLSIPAPQSIHRSIGQHGTSRDSNTRRARDILGSLPSSQAGSLGDLGHDEFPPEAIRRVFPQGSSNCSTDIRNRARPRIHPCSVSTHHTSSPSHTLDDSFPREGQPKRPASDSMPVWSAICAAVQRALMVRGWRWPCLALKPWQSEMGTEHGHL